MVRAASYTSCALVLSLFAVLVAPAAQATSKPSVTSASRGVVSTAPRIKYVDEAALTKKIAAYLKTRKGSASVSFRDLKTDEWYTYGPHLKYPTASIVKVDVLATLLLRHQRAHTKLTARERALASRMIRYSDNDATDALWARIGGWKGLAAANKQFGLVATSRAPSHAWGGTRTTAADQVRLLRMISGQDSVLTKSSRDYVLSLMHRVTPSQQWGVRAAADAHSIAHNKDGWAPQRVDGGRWEINSIGLIRVGGHLIAVSVLTRANPTMGYGQATTKHLATLVGTAIRHAR